MLNLYDPMQYYLHHAIAAGKAIIFPYYGLDVKTAQQLGEPIPKWRMLPAIGRGLWAAPKMGLAVATQIATQEFVENRYFSAERKNSFFSMITSSVTVGIASSPFLAALNGQTIKQNFSESLINIKASHIIMIAGRQICFLSSIRFSTPVSQWMKRHFGEHKAIEMSSNFLTGAIGSLCGHPFDTALTLWQKKMRVISLRQLALGGPVKAMTIGCFTMLYHHFK